MRSIALDVPGRTFFGLIGASLLFVVPVAYALHSWLCLFQIPAKRLCSNNTQYDAYMGNLTVVSTLRIEV